MTIQTIYYHDKKVFKFKRHDVAIHLPNNRDDIELHVGNESHSMKISDIKFNEEAQSVEFSDFIFLKSNCHFGEYKDLCFILKKFIFANPIMTIPERTSLFGKVQLYVSEESESDENELLTSILQTA